MFIIITLPLKLYIINSLRDLVNVLVNCSLELTNLMLYLQTLVFPL